MLPGTFHYGVHLGVTAASIARCAGVEVVVIQNAEKQELTPVAVSLDANGTLFAGRAAKDECESVPGNGFIGITRELGSDMDYLFARTGLRMRPEDLCAVVLRSLRADAEQDVAAPVTDCVLTVPSLASIASQESYLRAARLASFTTVHLVPEHIAAAIAHGFGKEPNKGYLLIYSFGDTAFEAALLRLNGKSISVVACDGDLQLGWQEVTKTVVESSLIPMVIRQRLLELLSGPRGRDALVLLPQILADAGIGIDEFQRPASRSMKRQIDLLAQLYRNERIWEQLSVLVGLTGFHWENPRWREAMRKLKVLANASLLFAGSGCGPSCEERLSSFCFDDKNAPMDLHAQLECEELKDLAAPFILKTICISRSILQRHGVAASELRKVIPLGAPTRHPIIWQAINKELGATPDFSVDPETAIVRGAAVYAAMRAESEAKHALKPNGDVTRQ